MKPRWNGVDKPIKVEVGEEEYKPAVCPDEDPCFTGLCTTACPGAWPDSITIVIAGSSTAAINGTYDLDDSNFFPEECMWELTVGDVFVRVVGNETVNRIDVAHLGVFVLSTEDRDCLENGGTYPNLDGDLSGTATITWTCPP